MAGASGAPGIVDLANQIKVAFETKREEIGKLRAGLDQAKQDLGEAKKNLEACARDEEIVRGILVAVLDMIQTL